MNIQQFEKGIVYYGVEKPINGGVIYLHSLTQGSDTPFAQAVIKSLIEIGFGVFTCTFDFLRDKTAPSPRLESEKDRVKEMIKIAMAHLGVEQVSLVGKSLGGCIAMATALESSSIKNIAVLGFPLALGFPPRVELLKGVQEDAFDAITEYKQLLGKVNCPMFLLQGGADGLGSVEDCKKLSDQVQSISIDVIEGADHSFMVKGGSAWEDCFAKLGERLQ